MWIKLLSFFQKYASIIFLLMKIVTGESVYNKYKYREINMYIQCFNEEDFRSIQQVLVELSLE